MNVVAYFFEVFQYSPTVYSDLVGGANHLFLHISDLAILQQILKSEIMET